MQVLHFPDKRLRNKAVEISEFNSDLKTLSDNMLETMYLEKGIGLAATQVNVQKRVVVIDLSEDKDSPMLLVNPKVLAADGTETMQEGCLSVPEFYADVERAEQIRYEYFDLNGTRHEDETDGLLAVCIQHEIDHLDGKLFIDYLSPLKRQRLKKKIEKMEKLAS